MKKLSKKEIFKRVKKFLCTSGHFCKEDFDEDGILSSLYDFKDYQKRYFIYRNVEECGCFESEEFFSDKEEVNELIAAQMNSNPYEGKWDNFLIFDVYQNKILIPKI